METTNINEANATLNIIVSARRYFQQCIGLKTCEFHLEFKSLLFLFK